MSDAYAAHQQRLAQIVVDSGCAAIALVPGPNFRYVSSLNFHLMERPTLLIATNQGQIIGIMPELERQRWQAAFPDAPTFYWQDSEGYAAAFSAAAAMMPTGRIGVEGLLMRVVEMLALETAFGPGRLVDADDALSSLRLQKSPEEIAALRKAVLITQTSLHEVLDTLSPGDKEKQIVARLKARMLANGADGFAFDPIVLIGENSAQPHGEPGERELRRGDLLLIDFGAMWGGMNADITRTVFFDHATDRHADIYNTVLTANERGRALAGPRVTAHDLDTAVTAVLKASEYSDMIVHKTGHGLGLLVHEAPQIMVGNHAPLLDGVVLTVEPGLYAPGDIGVRIEDDVAITATGSASLTDFPRDLTIVKETNP
ncbi:hypothetical protein A8B78_02685 [Jannaschia sp. EhC01]|nr:hypothetical protein A8B78_02685 [Jannaschia sp. EhC01]